MIRPELSEHPQVLAEAERIAHETTLTEQEAIVLAGDGANLSNDTIANLMGRSARRVRYVRRGLRRKKRDVGSLQKTRRALEDW